MKIEQELLYMAITSPFGIIAQSSNPASDLPKLYSARKTDPLFADLTFHRKDPGIWIVRKTPDPSIPLPQESSHAG